MADNSAQIRNALNTGATQIVVDGQTVQLSPGPAPKRLRELMATDDIGLGWRKLGAG